jgi:hypothetical protein
MFGGETTMKYYDCLMLASIYILAISDNLPAQTNMIPDNIMEGMEIRNATTVEQYREYQALQSQRLREGGKSIAIGMTPELREQLIESGDLPNPRDRSATMHTLNFRNAPLRQVLEYYTILTGKKVDIEPGLTATITLKTDKRITNGEAIAQCEEALNKQNICIVAVSTNLVKAISKAHADQSIEQPPERLRVNRGARP